MGWSWLQEISVKMRCVKSLKWLVFCTKGAWQRSSPFRFQKSCQSRWCAMGCYGPRCPQCPIWRLFSFTGSTRYALLEMLPESLPCKLFYETTWGMLYQFWHNANELNLAIVRKKKTMFTSCCVKHSSANIKCCHWQLWQLALAIATKHPVTWEVMAMIPICPRGEWTNYGWIDFFIDVAKRRWSCEGRVLIAENCIRMKVYYILHYSTMF